MNMTVLKVPILVGGALAVACVIAFARDFFRPKEVREGRSGRLTRHFDRI